MLICPDYIFSRVNKVQTFFFSGSFGRLSEFISHGVGSAIY